MAAPNFLVQVMASVIVSYATANFITNGGEIQAIKSEIKVFLL